MKDWKDWRSKGLGSSDAPVVMGVSPYKTRYRLWAEKTGYEKEFSGNWATQRGNELEPKARAQYELEFNQDMPPAFLEHPIYPFLRASLDGYGNNTVLEIKAPGAEDHALALAGKVPEKYYPQLQHQLLVSNAAVAHYYSFDGERGVLVQVLPDIEYCKKLLSAEVEFWEMIQTRRAPELCDRDYKTVQDKDVKALLMQWLESRAKLKTIEQETEELKTKIVDQLKYHPRWRYSGVKIYQVNKAGNVNYKSIPELKGVDLDKYRGKPTSYWTISEPKGTEDHGS